MDYCIVMFILYRLPVAHPGVIILFVFSFNVRCCKVLFWHLFLDIKYNSVTNGYYCTTIIFTSLHLLVCKLLDILAGRGLLLPIFWQIPLLLLGLQGYFSS